MLRASVIFFALGIFSVVLGLNGLASPTIDIGRMLLGVFLILTALSFVVTLISGKTPLLASCIAVALLLGFAPLEAERTVR